MSKIKYVKEPGFVYDLLFVYIFHFNKKEAFEYFVTDTRRKEDTAFFEEMIRSFPEPPQELLPLFHISKSKVTLITTRFFFKNISHYWNENGIDFICEKLMEKDKLKSELVSFYFEDILSSDGVMQCGLFELMTNVDNLQLSDSMKKALMIALANPEVIAQKTAEFFKSVEPIMQAYYDRHEQRIQEIYEYYTPEKIANLYSKAWEAKYEWGNVGRFFSVGLFACNCFRYDFMENGMGYIVGQFAENSAMDSFQKGAQMNLAFVAKAFADEMRVTIWKLLVQQRELTTTEIAQELKLPLSSCFYHLDIMQKARVLSSRSEGKTVLYKVNLEFVRLWQRGISNDISRVEGLK